MNKFQIKLAPPSKGRPYWKVILNERINNLWTRAIGQGASYEEAYLMAYDKLHPEGREGMPIASERRPILMR